MATTQFGDVSFTPNHDNKENKGCEVCEASPKSQGPSSSPSAARQSTPSSPCGVGDLAKALGQQNLHFHVTDGERLFSPSKTDDLKSPRPSSPTSTSISRLNSATRRPQQQANARMLSSSSHARDIATLVHNTIEVDEEYTMRDEEVVDMGSWSRTNRNFGFMFPGLSSSRLRADDRREEAGRVAKRTRMRKNRALKRA